MENYGQAYELETCGMSDFLVRPSKDRNGILQFALAIDRIPCNARHQYTAIRHQRGAVATTIETIAGSLSNLKEVQYSYRL